MQKNYPGMFNLTKGLMMIAIMMMHAVTDGLFGYGLNIQSMKLFYADVFYVVWIYNQKEIMESLFQVPEGDYQAILHGCRVCFGY